MSSDILFLILFGPVFLWWAWDTHKWEKTLERWRKEDAEKWERMQRRERGE